METDANIGGSEKETDTEWRADSKGLRERQILTGGQTVKG